MQQMLEISTININMFIRQWVLTLWRRSCECLKQHCSAMTLYINGANTVVDACVVGQLVLKIL